MAMQADPAANLQRAIELINEAAERGGEVVCLPELFHTLYFCSSQDAKHFDLAETTDGPTVTRLQEVAASLGVVLVVPFFEKRLPGLYHNSAAVIDADGSLLGLYRKMHIPQDPGFEEKYYFAPGDLGHRCFQTRFGRLGICICWDQWFPEAARLTALQGADVILYPTAIGWLPSEKPSLGKTQHQAWETVQRGHAIANGCYVAAVNRIGWEDTRPGGEPIEFWGQSFVASPYGEVIERTPTAEEGVAVVDLDLAAIEQTRRAWPFLRDRRLDACADLQRRALDA